MAILAKASSGGNYEPIPAGTHVAVCYGVYDLGLQYNEKFGIKAHKIMLAWELPDETMEIDGKAKPRAISKEYTLSLSEKATLRKELEAWRGRAFTKEELDGFDLKNILGKPCQVQVIHKTTSTGNVRANITAIMGLPKGMKAPDAANSLIYFDMTDSNASEVLSQIPDWIQTKIRASESYQTKAVEAALIKEGENDLPF